MKSYINTSLLLFLFSCNVNHIESDLEREKIKGNIKVIKENNEYRFYNKDGFIVKSYVNDNNRLLSINKYYYANNLRIRKDNIWLWIEMNNIFSESTTTYLFENSEYPILVSKSIKKDITIDNASEAYNYYYEGKKLHRKILEPYIDINGCYHECEIEYRYLDNGIMIEEEKNYMKTDNNYVSLVKKTNTYRNSDILREVEILNSLNYDNIKNEFYYEYDYDSNGNWIKQRKINSQTKQTIIIKERGYYYEDEDIISIENQYLEVLNILTNHAKSLRNLK